MEFKIKQNGAGNKQIDFGIGRDTQGFYQLAKKLERILDIKYSRKRDNFNTLTWEYAYHDVPFVLHFHWDSGTTIRFSHDTPAEPEEEQALDSIAGVLQEF